MGSIQNTSPAATENTPSALRFNQIDLIGHNTLFNRLLRDFMSDHLMLPARIQPLTDYQAHADHLILVNLGDTSLEILNNAIARFQQTSPQACLAVLKLDPQVSTDSLLSWPIVKGVLHGQSSDQLLLKGVQALSRGEYWFSRRELNILARMRTPPQPDLRLQSGLTTREQQILQLLHKGMSNEEIAAQLFLSKHTIKTHLYNLYRKLGIKNRTQALRFYNQENA